MARLQLKPETPKQAFVDGGWWPRSRRLPAELPSLIAAISARLGPVALVGYHANAWEKAPDGLDFEDQAVRLAEFTSEDPHTVVVVATDGRRITLLVVPPDATDSDAHQMLLAASLPSPGPGDPGEAPKESENKSLVDLTTRLASLEGVHDADRTATIGQWVDEAAEQFVDAPIQVYVPILVEHIVRGRIAADQAAG